MMVFDPVLRHRCRLEMRREGFPCNLNSPECLLSESERRLSGELWTLGKAKDRPVNQTVTRPSVPQNGPLTFSVQVQSDPLQPFGLGPS